NQPIEIQNAMFNLMKNNTYILYVLYSDYSWDIFATDLPKSRKDAGYENPNIISTYPKINGIISPNINNINITFSSPISRSMNNIAIYQTNTTTRQSKLRKFYSGNSEECTILNNNTFTCNVSQSIFDQWNSLYMIMMDNNFVKFASTNEPIYGIEANQWNFTTIPCDG
ncbi:5937_t:CDS:2, partial [Scutellospora calospora]